MKCIFCGKEATKIDRMALEWPTGKRDQVRRLIIENDFVCHECRAEIPRRMRDNLAEFERGDG